MRYVRHVIRIRDVARRYWFELLIAFLAIAGMLELLVGRDSPGAPPTTLWIAVPAVAVLVLPLFAPTLSVRRPCCLLDTGCGDLVRRRTVARVHRQPRPRRVGERVPARNLRDPLKANVGLIIVVVGIVVVVQHPRPTDSRRLRIHSPPVRGRLGRGLRLA